MNNWINGGANIDEAFNIIGKSTNKTQKQIDDDEPRDSDANSLNKENYQLNMEEIFKKYNQILNDLRLEIQSLNTKIDTMENYNKPLIEGFSPDINLNSTQIDQLIMLIFSGILVIILLNYLF